MRLLFWLFLLLGVVFAQEEGEEVLEEVLEDDVVEKQEELEEVETETVEDAVPIGTPQEYTAPSMNLTKIPYITEAVTDKKFNITIHLVNTADEDITNVVIYDDVPNFLMLVEAEGNTNTATFESIAPGQAVNFTYEVIPTVAGMKMIEGAAVNFTYKNVRQHQETRPLGEVFFTQNKGIVAVAIEWAVCIIIFCVGYLLWIIHKTKQQKETEKLLRSKGFVTKEKKTGKDKKAKKD